MLVFVFISLIFFAVVLMGHLTVVGAEAEEMRHILAEGMRAIDSKRHHLCILQETMTGTILLLLQVIMAALRSRCGHYIFALWFLSIFFFYFSPNLSGRKLMSTILPHMVWPCEFRMQV